MYIERDNEQNIIIRGAGHYKFICNTLTYLITIETDLEPVAKDESKANDYGIVGNFGGEHEWSSTQNFKTFETIDDGKLYIVTIEFADNARFKVRLGTNWNQCFGDNNVFFNTDRSLFTFTHDNDNSDIVVNRGGLYILGFSSYNNTIHVISGPEA